MVDLAQHGIEQLIAAQRSAARTVTHAQMCRGSSAKPQQRPAIELRSTILG